MSEEDFKDLFTKLEKSLAAQAEPKVTILSSTLWPLVVALLAFLVMTAFNNMSNIKLGAATDEWMKTAVTEMKTTTEKQGRMQEDLVKSNIEIKSAVADLAKTAIITTKTLAEIKADQDRRRKKEWIQ